METTTKTAKEIYAEVKNNPTRKLFGFGKKAVLVNIDPHKAYTAVGQFNSAYETDPQQPRLDPGGTYEYSSGCPLDTPSGMMHGTYRMETDDGEAFDVDIPAFSLDSPGMSRPLN